MKILIVDDEPGTRLTVSEAVKRLGHRALQAADGAEGLETFEFHHPEVVITDWAMPELDGTEMIARIRDRERDYTYILLLTGQAGEAASREAVQAGADDVLTKPLDPAELERGLIAAERIQGVHRRMTEDARRDPLTGAGSRRRLDEDLATLCARVVRYGHAYCVAMVGLEPGGDDVVRRAGGALVHEIRSGDAVYRAGPAEFVVLLPEQALDTANLAAERLRGAVSHAVPTGTKINVGIVTTAGPEPQPAALLELAEAAMRRSAQTGGVEDSESGGAATLRLIVADDDPVTRLMLGAILKREPGFELVGEAEDAEQAVELALRRRPDVVLLDVHMPGGGGARAAVEIREGLPEVRIVAISADDSQGSQYDMMRAGAVGFVIKGSTDAEILRVIRSITRWYRAKSGRNRGGAEGMSLCLLDRCERREVAGDARASAISDLALAAAGGPGQAPFLLAAVHDDRHVGIVFVVVGELRIELVGQRLRYDAVDHERDPSPLGGGNRSVMC